MTSGSIHGTSARWAALDEAAAAFGAADTDAQKDAALAALLESIGRLVAAGAPEEERRRRIPGTIEEARVARVLGREAIAEALESQAIAAIEALGDDGDEDLFEDRSSDEDTPRGEALARAVAILGCFEARAQAELELLGATLLTRGSAHVTSAGDAARLGFDLAVRPRAFELVAHNPARASFGAWVVPPHRARFWWWFEGLSIDPRAVTAMSAVASLVARSPEARDRFEQLVAAERGWSERERAAPGAKRSKSPGSAAKVTRLRDWIDRRAAGERPGLALAAAPLDEVLLLETSDAHVSWSPPCTLIVDLLEDRRPSGVPELLLGAAVVPGAPVPGAEERFAFELGAGALDGERAVLRLPLLRGNVEIDLLLADPA